MCMGAIHMDGESDMEKLITNNLLLFASFRCLDFLGATELNLIQEKRKFIYE